jgi:hypothetical protein
MIHRTDKPMPLFTQPPSPKNAPETAHAAADAIAQTAGQLRAVVLSAIEKAGAAGATDEELQDRLGMPANTQRPRRWELERAGLVRDSGQRRPTKSGRNAVVWVVIP